MRKNIVKLIKKNKPLVSGISVNDDVVDYAERELGVKFADEYREYLKKFGYALVCGLSITGITENECNNVVDITKTEKLFNENIPDDMYVVEELGVDCVVILQDTAGSIYICSPRHKIEKIFDSLYDYIERASVEYAND